MQRWKASKSYKRYLILIHTTITKTLVFVNFILHGAKKRKYQKEVIKSVPNNYLPKTNSNPVMPPVKTPSNKNCRVCSKSSVCKYQEVVTEEVERLVGELEKKELPLSVNINCNEFLQKQTVGVR